jgi:hypothetical protein
MRKRGCREYAFPTKKFVREIAGEGRKGPERESRRQLPRIGGVVPLVAVALAVSLEARAGQGNRINVH